MNGKDFAKWMDEAGIDLPNAAAHFGVSAQTIYNWRSTSGIPASRTEWVKLRMREFIANQGIKELPNRITLEPTRDQFRAWGKAALCAGQLIDDWAAASLDEAAAEDEADQTGLGASHDPIYRALKAAEPGEEYTSKKEASA
jgi:hypothetical protein